jgi:hypothetical protein
LTAGETARLEKRQARINTEVRNDRAANGGKLTPQEKARVNRQQDRQSRQIYRDHHNPGQQSAAGCSPSKTNKELKNKELKEQRTKN